MTARSIPLNLFGIPFGLTGLAGAWLAVAHQGHAWPGVGAILLLLAALTWLLVTGSYLRYALAARSIVSDLVDPVRAPFASLFTIVPMVLAADGLYPRAPTAGRLVVDVFLVLTIVLGAWFTGQWMYRGVRLDQFHPGHFLPTVAGGLLAARAAAQVGQHQLGEVMFGLGMICWLVLGSLILGRLLFRPPLPPALLPTMAIEVAPAAVATLAWFSLYGDRVTPVVSLFAGYGLLMVLAQLRLLPAFVRLPFASSTWAFTFSWAAVATTVIHWVAQLSPAGAQFYEYVVLAVVTALIGGIGVRTLVAVARRQFPAPPARVAPPARTTPWPT
ncbi:hypothetical protein [Myceligenerans indicum]|uniref:TDT family transporter n=1 Tax=Myceligenerans indicum TaxID=2593663 RepID=A0ABS1LGF8_9MICO|nr:hypothetical protein [Myceligenerans indicum]MBL0885281.1 TDT family transporter [Myceligenerans indicum]